MEWEALEAYAREGIRRLLQRLLEEEMEEVLGRRRYGLKHRNEIGAADVRRPVERLSTTTTSWPAEMQRSTT